MNHIKQHAKTGNSRIFFCKKIFFGNFEMLLNLTIFLTFFKKIRKIRMLLNLTNFFNIFQKNRKITAVVKFNNFFLTL